MRPYLKKTHHKKRLVEWLKVVGPEFKPQYCKKKKGWKSTDLGQVYNNSTSCLMR
jgi:hypothetical protein